ncbi:hypothetical protein DL96DRAFT_1235009 [Flagelloscypha sp. PMI_526]|nr:hypothetical protein DL96DRAFT_1235009 [Flagelloscypha sp. PMI_526]
MKSLLFSIAVLSSSSYVSGTVITDDASTVVGKTFDFVIAGGGLTGLVTANKISAKGYTVLVIEAGKNLPDHAPIYDVERRGELNNDPATDCNWHYTATYPNGTDMATKVDSGKCVGGSSSINGVMWYRPAPVEYDALESLGNTGWSANTLMPFVEAVEHNIPPTDVQRAQGANYNPRFHGFNGLVNTSFPTPMRIPATQALYKTAISSAYNIAVNDDLSDRKDNGMALASSSWTLWYDGQINRRSSAAYAFTYPASQQRDSLTILFGHTVDKVLFDKKVVANGIQFGPTGGGTLSTVKAAKEVLLAGGSLASPAILERSGIGAKKLVKSFGITSLVDLPAVGLNLQDQPGTGLSALVKDQFTSNTSFIDGRNIFAPVIGLANIDNVFGTRAAAVKADLLDKKKLKARAKAAVDAGAMVDQNTAEYIFGAAINNIVNQKTAIAEIIGESYPAVFTHIFWPSTPLSRGSVHIQSADAFAPPKIIPRFWTDDFDNDLGVTIAKKARDVLSGSTFAPYVAVPAADGPPVNATDAQWLEWLNESAFGASHWTGSCAMLPKGKGGVVSEKLKVYGTSGLRVIDASILPLQITSHTQSTAYAIAQKAAELVLADYN